MFPKSTVIATWFSRGRIVDAGCQCHCVSGLVRSIRCPSSLSPRLNKQVDVHDQSGYSLDWLRSGEHAAAATTTYKLKCETPRMHIHERRRHRDREPAHSKKIDKMKAPRPSLLVLLRFLVILAAASFVILAVHVEPAQGTSTYYARRATPVVNYRAPAGVLVSSVDKLYMLASRATHED